MPFRRGRRVIPRDLLNADQFKAGSATVVFQAKLDDFSDAFHECVQILSLGMAALESRDRRNVVAILIALDEDGEFSWLFHRV